jgi:TolB protein
VAGQVYRVDAVLSRSGEGGEVTERLSLRVVQQGAEWLVDELTFAGPVVAAGATTPQAQPSPAAPRPGPAPTATAVALSGKLAFMTGPGGPIYVVNADGSGLRQIADGLDPALSPDGSRLAFVRQGLRGGVYTVNVDGSGETNWFEQNKPRHPSWAPDGRRIVCSYEREKVFHTEDASTGVGYWTEVWALAVSDLEKRQTTDWPSALRSYSPAWSPGGELIAYYNGYGIDLVNMEGKTIGLTAEPGDHSPSWSPDGKRVAFQGWAHDHWDIMVVNVDGSGRRALTFTPFTAERAQNNVSPAWSPDGRQVAFVTDRSGRWEIWVMAADGSEQRPMFATGLPGGVSISYGNVREQMVSWGP